MATQWMTGGMSGIRTGLNYASLPMAWEACGVKKKDRVEVFEALRVMEDAALTYFQRLREDEAKKGN